MPQKVEIPVPHNHPIVKAWRDYKATEAFQCARRWALFPDNVDGSLWTMFLAGYEARAKEEFDRREPTALELASEIRRQRLDIE